jgi:hypothetical protein
MVILSRFASRELSLLRYLSPSSHSEIHKNN